MAREHFDSELTQRELRNIDTRLHSGSPPDRQRAARESHAGLRICAEYLQEMLESLRQLWSETKARDQGEYPEGPPAIDSGDQTLARFYSWLALLIFAVELYYAARFSETWATQGKPLRAILLAGSFVVLLTVFSHVLAKVTYNRTLPRVSRARLKRWAAWLATADLLIVAAFYYSRYFAVGTKLFPYLMVTIGVITSMLAGILFELAAAYKEVNRYAELYRVKSAKYALTSTLLEESEALLAATPFSEGRSARQSGPTAVVFLVALLLPYYLTAQELSVYQWWDVSGSLDPKHVEALRRSDLQQVIIASPAVRSVALHAFAGPLDAVGSPFYFLEVPRKRFEAKCREMTLAEKELQEAEKAYKNECDGEKERKRQERLRYERQLQSQLASALHKLRFDEGANASCIYQVIARCMAEPAHARCILFTDGDQRSCPIADGPIKPLLGAAPGGARTLVVVLPGKDDGSAMLERMEERIREIRKRAPGVTVIPSFQAGLGIVRFLSK